MLYKGQIYPFGWICPFLSLFNQREEYIMCESPNKGV